MNPRSFVLRNLSTPFPAYRVTFSGANRSATSGKAFVRTVFVGQSLVLSDPGFGALYGKAAIKGWATTPGSIVSPETKVYDLSDTITPTDDNLVLYPVYQQATVSSWTYAAHYFYCPAPVEDGRYCDNAAAYAGNGGSGGVGRTAHRVNTNGGDYSFRLTIETKKAIAGYCEPYTVFELKTGQTSTGSGVTGWWKLAPDTGETGGREVVTNVTPNVEQGPYTTYLQYRNNAISTGVVHTDKSKFIHCGLTVGNIIIQ